MHAFVNMHTVELMPEPHAGFISGMLRMLECFHAIVDTPRAQRMMGTSYTLQALVLLCAGEIGHGNGVTIFFRNVPFIIEFETSIIDL
ncbi:hypothetical protein C8J57DRAFT_1504756 [Mycena rebaudengoi]|nr:hypothetical protein C8J57DRAFT_1504756 [Mycena rebaudengoi]